MAKKFDLTDILEQVPKSTSEDEQLAATDVETAGSEHKLKGTTRLKDARNIPLHKIEPDPNQPRHNFNRSELQELANSIAEHGVIEPITVQFIAAKGYFQIIAGERRYRAAKLAGKTEIPCLIRTVEPADGLAIQLVENIQRQNLNPIEKANGLASLKELLGSETTWEKVETKTGISSAHRKKLISYLKLPAEVHKFIANENIARALLKVNGKPHEMKKIIAEIKLGKSGKQTLQKATSLNSSHKTTSAKKAATKKLQRLVIMYRDNLDLLQQLEEKIKSLKNKLKIVDAVQR